MSIPIAALLTKSTISLPKKDSSTIPHPTDSKRRTWTSWSPHPRSSHTPCTRIREPDVGHSCSRRCRTAARRPLHSVVQAHPSIPDTRSSVFCSYCLESFEWLHRWHGHDEVRRVSHRSVGILFREERTSRGGGSACKLARRSNQVELTCAALVGPNLNPAHKRRES